MVNQQRNTASKCFPAELRQLKMSFYLKKNSRNIKLSFDKYVLHVNEIDLFFFQSFLFLIVANRQKQFLIYNNLVNIRRCR